MEKTLGPHTFCKAQTVAASLRGVQRSLIDYGHVGIVGPRGHEIQPLTSTLCFGFKQVAFSSLTVSCQCLTHLQFPHGNTESAGLCESFAEVFASCRNWRRDVVLAALFLCLQIGRGYKGTQVIKISVSTEH